jgi:Na+-translocating ferredoxin:NAD+ oxidoreductase RnfD subunit
MSVAETVTSRYLYPKGSPKQRMFALWYFASLITLWTIAGHTFLGWEQSWATPIMAVGAAIIVTLILETVRAWSLEQTPLYLKGPQSVASLLLPALIPGLAVAMLLYPNERLAPIAFASTVAIASKVLIRAPMKGATQHIFNPSNFGIAVTLLLFPSVGIAPPYHLTENITGIAHWILPAILLASGIIVHGLFTGRLPLCLAWLVGFAAQGFIRSGLFGIPWIVPLMPMTSAAFILFTLYMIPDPATTPLEWKRQVAFGLAVAALYGVLITSHIVFGLFFALVGVCLMRGCGMWIVDRWERRRVASESSEVAVA